MKKICLFVNIIILVIFAFCTPHLFAQSSTSLPVNANFNQLTGSIYPTGSLQQSSFYPDITITPSPSISSQSLFISPQFSSFTPTVFPTMFPPSQLSINGFNLTYYCQNDPKFGNFLLPGGCTISKAGCGPTAVAMVLSGLVNQEFTPQIVTTLYTNEELNCKGSSYLTANKIFKENGLLTEMVFANNKGYQINQIAQDLQEFIKAGWLIFTLGRFYYPTGDCQTGCNHFFVIVNVDSKNVWVFDSHYGCGQSPPINILKYNQSPYKLIFKLAMAVKKPEKNL